MEHKSIFVLGRQPALGKAELESLFGADRLEPLGDSAMASDMMPEQVNFNRLGSCVRLVRPLATVQATKWPAIARSILQKLPLLIERLPVNGKIKIGFSVYDLDITPAELLRTGLEAKKIAKKVGRSARIVPNSEAVLNSGQVLHNHLTGELGIEIICLQNGSVTHLGQTVAIQDIDAYTQRDRGRPKRDAFVGMLPPKLAQTLVNLAVADANPAPNTAVLDPFCGTGVVLQEATLMGFDVYGSDLDPRMIEYTDKNLLWLLEQSNCPIRRPTQYQNDPDWRYFRLEAGDATTHTWEPLPDFVASETYLGQPLSSWPPPEKLHKIIGTCNLITQKFLQNFARQAKSGARLCLAVPAWQAPNSRLYHLPVLDQLEDLGYNRVSFMWAPQEKMVYHRPDQLVARELLVITRK